MPKSDELILEAANKLLELSQELDADLIPMGITHPVPSRLRILAAQLFARENSNA